MTQNAFETPASDFMQQVLPQLLARYQVSCRAEGDCIEYFLTEIASGEEISQNLMLSLNRFARQIEIIRFYPELNKQPDTKYFSAACLYLLIHHFAGYYDVCPRHKIFVRTQPEIFARFYKALSDFNFRPGTQIANTIELLSDFTRTDLDTSVIGVRASQPDELDFLIA